VNATGHLARASHRWKAALVCKALAGMVEVEIVPTFDGLLQEGLAVPFNPRVEYVEACEPFPWVVV
jgi:hypothetical protein